MNILYKILSFLKELFLGKDTLPDIKTPDDVVKLLELSRCINKFRLDNGLLPYFYSAVLEKIAQETANLNYKQGIITSYVDASVMSFRLRSAGMEDGPFAVISLKSDSNDCDLCHKLLVEYNYRAQLLDGFMNKIGIAKCDSYVTIILLK